MKKSTVLLVAAVLVLLASLTAYNMALRTEYRRGTYKDPLRDYAALPFTDFDEVVVEPGSVARVRIEAGPYQVRRSPAAAELLQVRQQGRRLVVSATLPANVLALGWGEALVIRCPRLTAVAADARFRRAGKPDLDQEPRFGRVLVRGFSGPDTLRLRQAHGSRLELQGNHLAGLVAEAGQQPGARPELTLDATNELGATRLVLGHQSLLRLQGARLGRLRYQLADSVRLELTGAALPGLAAAR